MAKKSTKSKNKSLKNKQTFSHREFALYILAAAIVGVFTLWVAFAAPHKPGSGSVTITLQLPPAKDLNGDGLPNFGDSVNFTVSTNADQTYVDLQCFQNGVMVAEGWRGFFPNALDYGNPFGLNSGAWQGGAADCTAYVKHYTGHGKNPYTTLASTSFHVNA